MEKNRVLIAIPAFNEEKTIKVVIENAKKYGSVIVFDDGSKDKTSVISGKLSQVISHKKNMGYEKTLKTIFTFFINSKFDLLITMDADGQHPPFAVKNFLNRFCKKKFDLCVGERPDFNRFVEIIFSKALKFFLKINDPLSGMKCYSKSFLKDFVVSEWPIQMGVGPCAFAKSKSYAIESIGIKVRRRFGKARVGSNLYMFFKLTFLFFQINFFLIISSCLKAYSKKLKK